MAQLTETISQVWKSARLYIGFHRDKEGARRSAPRVWPPKHGSASIHKDPSEQEVFLLVKNATETPEQDVQIRLRPDKIVLRRDYDAAWQGILASEHSVTVAVAGLSIRINHDGSITREDGESNTTWVEADGSILKKTQFVEASMSGDGVELARRTPDNLSAISENGVLSKKR